MFNLKSAKTQLIIFLVSFALYLSILDKDALFLSVALTAVISAALLDSSFIYFKERKFFLTDSSVISGLIIGFVLSGDSPLWIFVLASALAIASKHLIRVHNKHLFNPAAFGIFLATILAGAQTEWKGTYAWYILVPAGIYFVFKIRKLKLLIGYLIASLGLFGIQAIIQKAPLLNIFGYLSYFYIFIMMIEPKTTPVKPPAKLIFGMGLAILIFILTENRVKFDTELCSLLVLNLFVPLLNKIP